MTAQALSPQRFVRKTTLSDAEYNTNFHMLDRDIVEAVSSVEADQVTPLMSKIYLRLVQAPRECREREGVLHFEGENRDGKWVKAWDRLCQHLRVSGETARKALTWMHEQGIIGYAAFKNGVGIRIFLNRAAASIGTRQSFANKKFLSLAHASPGKHRASTGDTAFNDSFAVVDSLDNCINPHTPKNGVANATDDGSVLDPAPSPPDVSRVQAQGKSREVSSTTPRLVAVDEVISQLQHTLEVSLKTVAIQAAAREHERTREWLDKYGLPKAARVAQREAYKIHKYQEQSTNSTRRAGPELIVGHSNTVSCSPGESTGRTTAEISEVAEMCLALLVVHGKPIEQTLCEISAEGGWLLPADVPKVRSAAVQLEAQDGGR